MTNATIAKGIKLLSLLVISKHQILVQLEFRKSLSATIFGTRLEHLPAHSMRGTNAHPTTSSRHSPMAASSARETDSTITASQYRRHHPRRHLRREYQE